MIHTVLLGEICDVRDGTHDSPKAQDNGHPLVTSKHIKNFQIDFSTANLISSEDFTAVNKRSKVDKYDILISMIGTVGELAFIDYEPTFAIKNIGLIKTGDELLGRYLFYYLQSPAAKQYLEASLAGSTQKFIGLGLLRKFPVILPSTDIQQRIVDILGVIDEKIELNRKINNTFEQIGQALFRHYFINNPEAESWGLVPLSELCEIIASGGTPATKREDYYGGDIQWYSTKELKDNYLLGSEKTITDDGLSSSSAKLFPENTVVMAIYAAPTVGRLGILTAEASFNQATCGLVAKSNIGYEYIYLQLLSSRIELNNMANGAAQQNISVGKVRDFKVVQPDENTLVIFREQISPIFSKVRSNYEEIRTLTALRDMLLPRLINGKLKI